MVRFWLRNLELGYELHHCDIFFKYLWLFSMFLKHGLSDGSLKFKSLLILTWYGMAEEGHFGMWLVELFFDVNGNWLFSFSSFPLFAFAFAFSLFYLLFIFIFIYFYCFSVISIYLFFLNDFLFARRRRVLY